jgi:HK97 family phage portal protein
MAKLPFIQRVRAAYNAYTGRFTQLDRDGFPVYSFKSSSGIDISPDRAMYCTAVFACVALLSSCIANIPLKTYQELPNKDIEEAKKNPLYWLLAYQPNRWMTAYDYWLYNVECMLYRGGFISWINRASNGKILQLIPLHPDTVTRELTDTGEMLISGIAQYGPDKHLRFDKSPSSNFFWANYRTLDGLNPVSPIKYMAESIGLALAAEEHGARVFQNDATPPLVVSTAGKLSPEHLVSLAKMWKAGGTGENYGMPRFLDDGAKVEKLRVSNEDAQYMESRRFQREDICGIFRIAPSMISDTARAQGWSTLGQKNSDFLTYTLAPYLTNIEQAANRSLIPESDWGRVYVDYDTKVLMRADISTRTSYYDSMKRNSALTSNEIRIEEGYNRIEGGDDIKEKPAAAPVIAKTETPSTQIQGEENA